MRNTTEGGEFVDRHALEYHMDLEHDGSRLPKPAIEHGSTQNRCEVKASVKLCGWHVSEYEEEDGGTTTISQYTCTENKVHHRYLQYIKGAKRSGSRVGR